MTDTRKRCRKQIDGPRIKDGGRTRPLWRRQCKNLTQDSSGYCHVHRKEGRRYGVH